MGEGGRGSFRHNTRLSECITISVQDQIFLRSQTYPNISAASPQYHCQQSDHYDPQDDPDKDGPNFLSRDTVRVPSSQHGDGGLTVVHDNVKCLLVTSQISPNGVADLTRSLTKGTDLEF